MSGLSKLLDTFIYSFSIEKYCRLLEVMLIRGDTIFSLYVNIATINKTFYLFISYKHVVLIY